MRLIIVPEKLSKGEKEERDFFLHQICYHSSEQEGKAVSLSNF